ncbi:MAG: sensor hybrid histidine kinase [Herbinix sp.]|jgi:PAS domain S-box-containing protein|nr:sensor hybrid histidine kinase [Herbinix sp.]
MLNLTKEELAYYNCVDSGICIYEPVYDANQKAIDFPVLFMNDYYRSDPDLCLISEQNGNLRCPAIKKLLENFVTSDKNYKVAIETINSYNQVFVMQIHWLNEKYLHCTYFKQGEVLVRQQNCTNINYLDNLMDIILIVDEKGNITYGNKRAVAVYGYSYEDLTNMSVFELRNYDKLDNSKRQLEEAFEKGIEFCTYHYTKDGYKLPVKVRSIYGKEDCRKFVISIISDNTQLEKLSNTATMFSAAQDIFDDTLVGLTKDFDISLWNKGAESKLGYHKEEIIGKNIRTIIPEDKLDEFEQNIKRLQEGNVIFDLETLRIHKDGRLVDISMSLAPIFDLDGMFAGGIGIYKDISEKKEMAKKLKDYEERARLALEGGRFGIWDEDLQAKTIVHHNSWKEILGYGEDNILDSIEKYKSLLHPEDITKIFNQYHKHLNGEEYVIEYRMKCKSGEYKWIRTKGKIIEWTKDGKPLRMVGTNEEISDRKRIELKLQEQCEQLELLRREAENANNAKSVFLANISHELRTPMNAINGIVQLFQLSSISKEQSKYLQILKDSSDTLMAIINDILDISKIESGTIHINQEPFDLRETVNNLYNNLMVIGNSKGLETSYYLDPEIHFPVIGDEIRLKQILTNIIYNAIKFTEQGFVSFRIKKASEDDNMVRIEFRIKDSGIGIEDSFKDKIFNNFSQGDLSYKKKYAGAGLGLAIAKKLSFLMQGDITFESKVGEGSTFIFCCEFQKQKPEVGSSKDYINKDHEKEVKPEKTVLCVEDNLYSQEVLESLITRKGYHYLSAYNGKEALEILKNNKVDLILMDIQLPELDGFDTTEIIRREFTGENGIPIIAITAYAMREDKDKCILAGMNDYIAKPFEVDHFYSILEYYLKL